MDIHTLFYTHLTLVMMDRLTKIPARQLGFSSAVAMESYVLHNILLEISL